jgi:hypothetical protein
MMSIRPAERNLNDNARDTPQGVSMAIQENRFDTLDDEALLQHLVAETEKRREHLTIEERHGEWVAETYQSDGLSAGRSVMLGASGPNRREAMLGLAEKFEANRW